MALLRICGDATRAELWRGGLFFSVEAEVQPSAARLA